MSHIADPGLAEDGAKRVEWARSRMPVLASIRQRFEKETPLQGRLIGACLHVTAETANLMLTLRAGGADVALCASNPLSTQDDVAAALAAEGVPVFAVRGEDADTYYDHIRAVLDLEPDITMDDGADLITTLLKERPRQNPLGSTEETTTGVIRLRAMAEAGVLRFPVIAVNDSATKHLFDNRHGTGQSALDGLIRATNLLIAGKTVVVVGYGDCGSGVAARARGLGARVVVVEVDPVRALSAVMEGYTVATAAEAAPTGDVFITVTGNLHVLRGERFDAMRDGVVLANAGHFNVDLLEFGKLAKSPVFKWLTRVCYYVIPNISNFKVVDSRNVIQAAAYSEPVNYGALGWATVYGILYSGILLGIAVLIFSRRDFK